jgi:2-polyprenyl-6-methoxyphenol hydroxylase-like FAD-dependent oxidoreductase
MSAKSVLISGAGIAGPTLAFWLAAAGFQPTIVERAADLRTGGYVVDFWGLGYDIAERMGLRRDLEAAGYHIRELRVVGDSSEKLARFGVATIRALAGGRFVTIPRSVLSRLLFDRAVLRTEVMFGDQIASIEEDAGGANVAFERPCPPFRSHHRRRWPSFQRAQARLRPAAELRDRSRLCDRGIRGGGLPSAR